MTKIKVNEEYSIMIGRRWFRKRVWMRIFEYRNGLCDGNTRLYSFSYKEIRTIISAYYSFVFNTKELAVYHGNILPRREVNFHRYGGITIGCQIFTPEVVAQIYEAIF